MRSYVLNQRTACSEERVHESRNNQQNYIIQRQYLSLIRAIYQGNTSSPDVFYLKVSVYLPLFSMCACLLIRGCVSFAYAFVVLGDFCVCVFVCAYVYVVSGHVCVCLHLFLCVFVCG